MYEELPHRQFIRVTKKNPDVNVTVNTTDLQRCFEIERNRGKWIGLLIPFAVVTFGYFPEWLEQWKFNRQDRKKDEAILQEVQNPDQGEEPESQEKQGLQ